MVLTLDTPQDRRAYFSRCVGTSMAYWLNYLAQHNDNIDALDSEWEAMAKVVGLALCAPSHWGQVYKLSTILAEFMERRGYWDASHMVLVQALDTAERVGDAEKAIELSLLLARLAQRQGNVPTMVRQYRHTLQLTRQFKDRFNEGRVLTNLGFFYVEYGAWYRAEVLCCYALEIFNDIDSNYGRAHTYNHLGLLYTQQGHWEQAQQHLEQACQIWRNDNDKFGLMRGLINLGVLHIWLEQGRVAIIASEEALTLATEFGDELARGKLYSNLGLAYALVGDFVQANAAIQQNQIIVRKLDNPIELTTMKENTAIIAMRQQDWETAYRLLLQVLDDWRSLSHHNNAIVALTGLVECAWGQGNREQARIWLTETRTWLQQPNRAALSRRWQAHIQQLDNLINGQQQPES